MSQRLLAFLSLALVAGTLKAQPLQQPAFAPADQWTYATKFEEAGRETILRKVAFSVIRSSSRSLVVSVRLNDSDTGSRQEVLNPDWSKPISINGVEVVTRRPFNFPLEVGKTWTVNYVEPGVAPGVKFQRNEMTYTVVGWEDVKVPAGQFKALKIEVDGTWYKEFDEQGPLAASSITNAGPTTNVQAATRKAYTPPPATGRRYQVWWYAPEVKREIKLINETTSSNGNLGLRESSELEVFSLTK